MKVNMGEAGEVEISNREFMKLIGESVRSRTVVSIPAAEGFSIEPLFQKHHAIWDFNKDHEFLDTKKALAILVPPELWKSGGGSYAKAQVQSFWFEQTIASILDEVKRYLRYGWQWGIQLRYWAKVLWGGIRGTRPRPGRQEPPRKPKRRKRHADEPRDLEGEVNRILDKVLVQGADSLTPEEKEIMRRYSDRMKH